MQSQIAPEKTGSFESILIDQIQAAVIGLDLAGRITYWNRFAAELWGIPSEEALGRRLFDLLAQPDGNHAGDAIELAATGAPSDREYVVEARSGDKVAVQARISPIRDAKDVIVGAVAICVDVGQRKRMEQRTTTQYEVTRVLEESESLAQAAPRLLETLCRTLEFDLAALWEVDPEHKELRSVNVWRSGTEFSGFEDTSMGIGFPSDIGLPGKVWATGRPSWIADMQHEEGLPRRSAAFADGLRGAFAFPIIVNREVVGIIEASSSRVGEPDPGLLELMAAIGSQIGQFIDRKAVQEARKRTDADLALLLQRERAARTQAERAQERLAILATASDLLSEGLDYGETLKQVAGLAVPGLADWCSVDVLESGNILNVAVAHADPAKVELAQRLQRDYPQDPGAPGGSPYVLRTGESQLYPEITDEHLVIAAHNEEHLNILRELGLASVMILPLSARGRTFGAINFVSAESGRRYTQDDLSFATDLARRAALALDNARLYEERNHVARTLQNSLLPPRLPSIPGVEVAARYRAAGRGNDVGGDFFDVFEVDDDEWALVIGDVCGKGVGAAAVTGLARHTVRAAAMRERYPSDVLGVLNQAILRADVDERFCTAVFVQLQAGRGARRLELSSGGHPAPFVLRSSGDVEPIDCPGILIGLFEDAKLHDRELTLQPGDALVLYTDGMVEGRDSELGEHGLRSVLESCAGLDAAAIGERVEERVVESQGGDPADDIAVLVLRVP